MKGLKDLSLYVVSLFVVSMAYGHDIIDSERQIVNLAADSKDT